MRPPSELTELRKYLSAGRRVKYVFFWSHRPSHDGLITKNCLSQWFDSSFEVDGVRYPSAEHFMMAKKAQLFRDYDAVARILKANNPGAAKAIGRQVRGFEEEVWIAHRCSVAIKGNFAKFSQNPLLHSFLVGTADRVLVEASPVDPIWGIGLAEDDAAAQNPNLWKGLNLLGFALMDVRDRLRESQARA